MSSAEAYLARVEFAVRNASEYVSNAGLAEVRRLVDHGEPAEGMCILAWVIVNEDARVPASLVRDIRDLSRELIGPEHFPSNLEHHVVEGE